MVIQLLLLFMRRTATLDSEVGVNEVCQSLRDGTLDANLGGIPVEISDYDLGNSDFPVQMEGTIIIAD